MTEYKDQANALADREEARNREIDAAGPYECSGIMWRTVDGEPVADGAVWGHFWDSLFDHILEEPWATQKNVYCLASQANCTPSEGVLVPRTLAEYVFAIYADVIEIRAQEAGR